MKCAWCQNDAVWLAAFGSLPPDVNLVFTLPLCTDHGDLLLGASVDQMVVPGPDGVPVKVDDWIVTPLEER